jgi:hypothetical protein
MRVISMLFFGGWNRDQKGGFHEILLIIFYWYWCDLAVIVLFHLLGGHRDQQGQSHQMCSGGLFPFNF